MSLPLEQGPSNIEHFYAGREIGAQYVQSVIDLIPFSDTDWAGGVTEERILMSAIREAIESKEANDYDELQAVCFGVQNGVKQMMDWVRAEA